MSPIQSKFLYLVLMHAFNPETRPRLLEGVCAPFDTLKFERLGASPVLVIPRALLDDVYNHARTGLPEEVCGILAGHKTDKAHEVTRVYRVNNVHHRPIGQFQLDPKEQLRVLLEVEDDLGLDILGFYHSHPTGPPRLSATDAARANWPGVSYLLVYLKPREGHLSARYNGETGQFDMEDVEVV